MDPISTLTYILDTLYPHGSLRYTYKEIVKYYFFDVKTKTWTRRSRPASNVTARLVCTGRTQDTRALALMLEFERGPTSFDDLLSSSTSWTDAAAQRRLMPDPQELAKALKELPNTGPEQARTTFAQFIFNCRVDPNTARQLWQTFKVDMRQDFVHVLTTHSHPTATPNAFAVPLHRMSGVNANTGLPALQRLTESRTLQLADAMALGDVRRQLHELGATCDDSGYNRVCGLEEPPEADVQEYYSITELGIHSHDRHFPVYTPSERSARQAEIHSRVSQIDNVEGQKRAYSQILEFVRSPEHRPAHVSGFLLHAPAG